ncbi:MAG: VCBS repeat-containing protein [Gemmatimonadota bacterium]
MTTCSPATAGQFDFLPAQSFSPPVTTPFETRLVDVNGDGRSDMVFNHRDANTNQVAVALAGTTGSFAMPGAAVSHPATPATGWAGYDLHVGDFNGDGNADLLWNQRDSINSIYVALANGSGGWTFEPVQQATPRGWNTWGLYVGDLDNDGSADLIWNRTSDGNNTVFTGMSNGDGTFALDSMVHRLGTGGWAPYITDVADVNSDGRTDLIFNTINISYNQTEVGTSNGDGTFNPLEVTNRSGGDWRWYQNVVADFNGDQKPDWLFYRDPSGNPDSRVYILSAMSSLMPYTSLANALPALHYTAMGGDVNGDGTADLILNYLSSTTNTIAVFLGTASGVLSAGTTPLQVHPVSANWSVALPAMVGDVNGDGRADVVWVIPGSPTRVFVAESRSVGVSLASEGTYGRR